MAMSRVGAPGRPHAVSVGLLAVVIVASALGLYAVHPVEAGGVSHPVPVLVIGGSAAAGWVDKRGPGYVVRGVLGYGAGDGFDFVVTNHAIPGAPVVDGKVQQHFAHWVARLGPGGVVVIAWGLLNDIRLGIARSRIRRALRDQIATALRHADMVVLVTPPATRSTYVQDARSEPRLVGLEIRVAKSFHSPKVVVANVFRGEKAYLNGHHETYRPLMDGLWDPNTRGQRLAGTILARTLKRVLPSAELSSAVAELHAAGAVPRERGP